MAVRREVLKDDSNPNPHNVSNPHPGFEAGDPNIINEFGHTKYPKWVDHPTEKEKVNITTHINKDTSVHKVVENPHPKRVLVQNEDEEKALLGGGDEKAHKKGWADKK